MSKTRLVAYYMYDLNRIHYIAEICIQKCSYVYVKIPEVEKLDDN